MSALAALLLVCDGFRADGAVFDEGNLVSHAGLVPLSEMEFSTTALASIRGAG